MQGHDSFQQNSEFLNIHLHAWDGPKTWYRTLLPSYLLHFFFKRNRLVLDEICEVHKTENFDYIQPLCQSLLNADGRIEQIILSFCPKLYSVKPAPFSNLLWFCSYGPNCIVNLELTFCVWSIFRIFEHGEDKLQFPRKNEVGDITTSSLI